MRSTSLLLLRSSLLGLAVSSAACGVVKNATKSGMKPILENSIAGFVSEPDLIVAEGAMLANLKLIEGIVATYPGDRDFLILAAMARANYGFAFIEDELQAVKFAYPTEPIRAEVLVHRAVACFDKGRLYAEAALAETDAYATALSGRKLEELELEELRQMLAKLKADDAEALFWLAFNWGGRLQITMDPVEATQLPKIEAMVERVLELDDRVFYDVGPHMMAGVFHGFRSPALGGNPEKAKLHLEQAAQVGKVLLPAVLEAQFVYAQTEEQEAFEQSLKQVIEAGDNHERALFDALAKRKACRLLANIDQLFLTDAKPVPSACDKVPQKHPLRAEPLEPVEEEDTTAVEAPEPSTEAGPEAGGSS